MSVKEDYKHFKETKLPSLARFHFRVWRIFTSEFGAFSLPSLALFYFRVWHLTAKPMTQHVVMTAERMTLRDDTFHVMTICD